ncbi:MAG TPA: hypothetical protein PLQ93_13195 [Bacteroidia bacterium]|nr:hypothetical protein [Bacteroidia bacterium]
MKTRTTVRFGAALLLGAMLFGSHACKKKQEFKNEDGQSTVDSRTVQGENDAVMGDANTVISDQGLLSGREASSGAKLSQVLKTSICGLTVDTTQVTSGILTLNYNGTVCNNRKREGSIRLTILNYPLNKWKQAGTVLKVEYLAYKVSRASDGKSVLINGTVNVTNKTGGTWVDLAFFGKANVIHEVEGNGLKVKYDNGTTTAEYNIHRRYTYTYSNLVFTCKGEGLGTNDGISNLENWGTTRNGDSFTSEVVSPVVWNTTCGGGAPTDGEIHIKVSSKDFTMKCIFAVDASGNEVSVAPNTCAYGWKVEWSYKNKTKERIFLYN